MARFFAHRDGDALRPVDDAGRDALSKIKNMRVVLVDAKVPRNIKMHRLYFGLLNTVLPHQDTYADVESLHCAIKMAVGLRKEMVTLDGEVLYVPGSIDFAAMDDIGFRDFYDRVCDLVVAKILPHLDGAALRREVSEMVGI